MVTNVAELVDAKKLQSGAETDVKIIGDPGRSAEAVQVRALPFVQGE